MSSTQNRLHKAFGVDVAAHGDLSKTNLDPNVDLEVIALGLSRTGTTSLQAALTKLGFGPSHQGVDLFRSIPRTQAFIDIDKRLLSRTWQAGDPELSARLHFLMRGYRSSTDNPINSLANEIYAAYPTAKYILTTRQDGKDGWWGSISDATGWHFRRDYGRYIFRFLISSVQFLRLTDDKVQLHLQRWREMYGAWDANLYTKHNAHVQNLVPKEQLLVYDVREGWEPLCSFLEVPVPDEPFPQLNDTGAMRAIYFGMMTFGAFTWALYGATATAAGWIALHPKAVQGWWMNLIGAATNMSQRSRVRV